MTMPFELEFPCFVSTYSITVNEMVGTRVSGCDPTGRSTGTCDRCGRAIMHVAVFGDRRRTRFVHVGLDCAQRMGVAPEEVEAAERSFENARRAERAAASAARRAEYEAAELAQRRENCAAAAVELAWADAIVGHPHATQWERDEASRFASDCERWGSSSRDLGAILARLALCATSRARDAARVKGLELVAYRAPVRIEGAYGARYVSFLCDDAGCAYVYVGSSFAARRGDRVAFGAVAFDGSEHRDGLTATRLSRPSKVTVRGEGE
jgi:hypothetical protein